MDMRLEQVLGPRDCDSAVGELVLRGDAARMFAPGGSDLPFSYSAVLDVLPSDRQVVVRVSKAAAGSETLFTDGWGQICVDYNLMPGDVIVLTRETEDLTFVAYFLDANDNDKIHRLDAPYPRSSPEFVPVIGLPSRRRGGQAAGAAAWGEPALQGHDMTIRGAMDLAVECGAQEGSDEHYMATKLFVKAENRAMFGTFRTNAGRLQWLRRCYEDQMN